jgi:hypothetical protein
MGEWTDLELETPRKHVERHLQRNTRARAATRWSAMQVWPRSTTLWRHLTMRRRITPHSSRVAELDEQLPRYGLRKRTAHQMASDGKSLEDAPKHLEDASKHQNLPKRPKRTPNFTRAQSSSLRGSAKRKTR